MTRMILCKKLNQTSEGLKRMPYPGPLGQYIYENISEEAWKQWLKKQTMLINEYRLEVSTPQTRTLLEDEMKKFFNYSA